MTLLDKFAQKYKFQYDSLEHTGTYSPQDLNNDLVNCVRDAVGNGDPNYAAKFLLGHLGDFMFYCTQNNDFAAKRDMESLITEIHSQYSSILEPDVNEAYEFLARNDLMHIYAPEPVIRTVQYGDIAIQIPEKRAVLTHSIALDMIRGESSTENMDWTDMLGSVPWGKFKNDFFEAFDKTCNLFSLLHLDYQVCNGGISQYFFNRYHEEREPHFDDDVALYGIDDQKREFKDLVKFGREIFPSRADENNALQRACDAFQRLSFEEDARVTETVFCEEDEYIIDEETGEEIENPDYFEPYDEDHYEDVIHGDDGFDDIFYAANDYMEELLELRAQFFCKRLAMNVEKSKDPAVLEELHKVFPDVAFPSAGEHKPSLADQISDASFKAISKNAQDAPDTKKVVQTPERG